MPTIHEIISHDSYFDRLMLPHLGVNTIRTDDQRWIYIELRGDAVAFPSF